MLGLKWRLDLDEPIDFANPEWGTRLRTLVSSRGVPDPFFGLDYFVFPRGLYARVPPFAVGRPGWDNWMVYWARSSGIAVIDATQAVTAVHQEHTYVHHPQGRVKGRDGVYKGPEAQRNIELAGGLKCCFNWQDATWLLTPRGLRPALSLSHLRRFQEVLPILYPQGGLRATMIGTLLEVVLRSAARIRWSAGFARSKMGGLARRARLALAIARRMVRRQ